MIWSTLFYTYNRGFRIRVSDRGEVSRIAMGATHDAGERVRA